MVISDVLWLSEDGHEAEVTVVDGYHQIRCFAQPFLGAAGDAVSAALFIVDPDGIVKTFEQKEEISQGQNAFSCQLAGQLCDKQAGLLRIGKIYFELDARLIPGDMHTGDFVSLWCGRVDL